jgi:hypothetical protein
VSMQSQTAVERWMEPLHDSFLLFDHHVPIGDRRFQVGPAEAMAKALDGIAISYVMMKDESGRGDEIIHHRNSLGGH